MKRVLTIGDIMLDRYIIGSVDRISPEAPVPVVRVQKEELKIGGAGNVALNIVKQYHSAILLGYIGHDINGVILKKLLQENGIDIKAVEISLPTISKTRIVGNMQQIVRFDQEEVSFNNTPLYEIRRLLDPFDFEVVVISDYKKGVCSPEICNFILDMAKKNKTKVIVDPKGTDWERYKGAYLVTPNLKELAEISVATIANEDAEIEHFGTFVKEKFHIKNLLVTRSEKGMTLLSDTGVDHIHTSAKSVYDVTGAGDTVVATLAVALCEGLPLLEAVVKANYAAGIAVSKFGTYAVTKEDLNDFKPNI